MQERKYMQRCVGQMQRCILMDVSGVQKQYCYKAYLENAFVSSANGIAMAMDLKFRKKIRFRDASIQNSENHRITCLKFK